MTSNWGGRRRSSLPVGQSTFVGRAAELQAVDDALERERLVTLTGPGGVGKTRIALEAADRIGAQLAQGAHLVELSPLLDDTLVAQAVAHALGVADRTARPLVEVLAEYLRERELLLVLDTCDHLVEACGRLARQLLGVAPRLRILATSRQALGVPGEHRLTIGPMDSTANGDAVALLLNLVQEGPEVPAAVVHQPRELARLCTVLDGIPLAIELAAVHLRTMPANQLVARLTQRMSVLSPYDGDEPGAFDDVSTAQPLARPSRHTGLRTTIGWSHEWCTPHERLLWARLSVFPGSFDITAVDFVCTGDSLFGYDLTDGLNSLIAKSLVLREGAPDARRYRMLDTIRDYGAEWLERIGQTERLRLQHRDYYRHLAMTMSQEWMGPEQPRWHARMTAERPNLQAAMELCLQTSVGASLDMAGDLLYFWFCCGNIREGRRYTESALALDPSYESGRARALWSCALLAIGQGELDAAVRIARDARDVAVRTDDEAAEAGALYVHAGALTLQGDAQRALPEYAQAHDKADHTGLDFIKFLSLASGAYAHLMRGEADQVRAKVRQLADLAGDMDELWVGAYGGFVLGNLCVAQGHHRKAIAVLRRTLEAKWLLDDLYGTTVTLETLACACAGDQQPELATRILGIADRAWDILGTPHLGSPAMTELRRVCEEAVRATLGTSAYTKHYLTGFAIESVPAGVRDLLDASSHPDLAPGPGPFA